MIDTLLQEPGGAPSAVAIQLLFKCFLPKLVAASVDSRSANVSFNLGVILLHCFISSVYMVKTMADMNIAIF